MTVVWLVVGVAVAGGMLTAYWLSRSPRCAQAPPSRTIRAARLQAPSPPRPNSGTSCRSDTRGPHLPADPQRPRGGQLVTDLRAALSRQQLVLHYQPEVTLATGKTVGLEALIRWQHPRHGLLHPGSFIEAVENSDVIVPLGRWVLHEATTALARLRRHHPTLQMSINVSPRQLEHDVGWADEVMTALASAGVPPAALRLEITETALMGNLAACQAVLHDLEQAGVGIAIDDFGTGHSGLSYLHKLPVDLVKIDKSFVDQVSQRVGGRAAVVDAVVQLVQSMGLNALAEGIEHEGQADHLRRLKCEYGQGYLFARPLPADAVQAWLDDANASLVLAAH